MMNKIFLEDIKNSKSAFAKKSIKRKNLSLNKKSFCIICKKEFHYLLYPTAVCSVECGLKWLKKPVRRKC